MSIATATQMLPAIGQTVRAQFEDLIIEVRVSDVKSSYGRVRLLVSPVAGTGSQWIEVSRLRAAPSGSGSQSLIGYDQGGLSDL